MPSTRARNGQSTRWAGRAWFISSRARSSREEFELSGAPGGRTPKCRLDTADYKSAPLPLGLALRRFKCCVGGPQQMQPDAVRLREVVGRTR